MGGVVLHPSYLPTSTYTYLYGYGYEVGGHGGGCLEHVPHPAWLVRDGLRGEQRRVEQRGPALCSTVATLHTAACCMLCGLTGSRHPHVEGSLGPGLVQAGEQLPRAAPLELREPALLGRGRGRAVTRLLPDTCTPSSSSR